MMREGTTLRVEELTANRQQAEDHLSVGLYRGGSRPDVEEWDLTMVHEMDRDRDGADWHHRTNTYTNRFAYHLTKRRKQHRPKIEKREAKF